MCDCATFHYNCRQIRSSEYSVIERALVLFHSSCVFSLNFEFLSKYHMEIFLSLTELCGTPSILPKTSASFISPTRPVPARQRPSGLLSLFSRRQLEPRQGRSIVQGHTAMKQSSGNPNFVQHCTIPFSPYIGMS